MDKYPKKTIGELCHIEKGVTGLASAEPGPYPLVATSLERKSCNSYQFDTQAVCIPLVSSTGHGKKTLNYVHYQEGKFALGTILAAVIPKDAGILSAGFLHRYLQFFKETKLVSLMKGAANVSLAVKDIAKIEIPVPPIEEQVQFIELFNKANSFGIQLVGEFNTQSNYLKKLRQSILQEAIEGKLTADWRKTHPVVKGNPDFDAKALLEAVKVQKEKFKKDKSMPEVSEIEKVFNLPKGWIWCRLGEVCSKIGSGSTPSGSNYSTTGIPFFRSQNIYNSGLIYSDIKYISHDVHTQMNGTIVSNDDLLLNITGGSLGRCAHVPRDFKEGNVSQHVCIIRPINCNSSFFHKLILSQFFQSFVFNSTTGAGREGLPKYNLEQFVIPVPPVLEQQAIVDRVDSLLAMVDLLEKQVNERKVMADELMQSVLREAFG